MDLPKDLAFEQQTFDDLLLEYNIGFFSSRENESQPKNIFSALMVSAKAEPTCSQETGTCFPIPMRFHPLDNDVTQVPRHNDGPQVDPTIGDFHHPLHNPLENPSSNFELLSDCSEACPLRHLLSEQIDLITLLGRCEGDLELCVEV